MLEKLFLQILNMSFSGGIVIVFILLFRLLLKKAPKIFSYGLWAVVLFRLVCPYSFESRFSLLPIKPSPISQDITFMHTPRIDTGIAVLNNAVNSVLPEATPDASVNPLQIWVYLGSLLWVLGITLLLLYSLARLVKLKKCLRGSTLYGQNIFISSRIGTAFVVGIYNPKIYLPKSLGDSDISYILLQEQTHIRRLDHVVKLLSFLVLCIHWFNPLVWVAFFLCGKDMEFSCDEAVIKRMGNEVKKDYSTSLLALAAGRRIPGGVPLVFCRGDTKDRVNNVLRYKKPAFWVVPAGMAAMLALAFALISNPKEKLIDRSSGFVETDTISLQNKKLRWGTYSAENLCNAATPYIGNNEAVRKLIELLPAPMGLRYDHFALQTSEQPYHQIEIVYSVSEKILAIYDSSDNNIAVPFRKNALLLLALVDNADVIQFILTDGSRKVGFINGREWAEYTVGGDVRDYAHSPEKLQELIGLSVTYSGK